MSDTLSTTLRVPRQFSLAIAAPTHVLAVKIYLIAAIAGVDLYAPVMVGASFLNWSIRRGDIIDAVATTTIFIELMKATRIDFSGQVNYALSIVMTIGLIAMMMMIPAATNVFTVKLAAMSVACAIATAVLRVSIARRDLSIGS